MKNNLMIYSIEDKGSRLIVRFGVETENTGSLHSDKLVLTIALEPPDPLPDSISELFKLALEKAKPLLKKAFPDIQV